MDTTYGSMTQRHRRFFQQRVDSKGKYPVPTAAPAASPSIYCFSVARGGPEMAPWHQEASGEKNMYTE